MPCHMADITNAYNPRGTHIVYENGQHNESKKPVKEPLSLIVITTCLSALFHVLSFNKNIATDFTIAIQRYGAMT